MMSTKPKPFVFVLMPFDRDFDDVYQMGIKPACEKIGAYAERVDEQDFFGSIIQRVYNQISKADVIVSDMTGRKPNVFYETGYAHALDKQVILLTQKAEDIPFDLKDYPHIVYGGRLVDLVPKLEQKVSWAIQNSGRSPHLILPTIQFYCDGSVLKDGSVLIFEEPDSPVHRFDLQLDFNNIVERVARTENAKIGICSSEKIRTIEDCTSKERKCTLNRIRLSQEMYLHIYNEPFKLFPGEWDTAFLVFNTQNGFDLDHEEKIRIRVYTEFGSKECQVTFRFKLGKDSKHRRVYVDHKNEKH